jgi:serine/threonine protein kinase
MGSKFDSGTLIADRYWLDRVLGEGGMGVVRAATHEAIGEPVALKLVKAAGDPARQSRMVREVRAASAVRHPNVCAGLDFVELRACLRTLAPSRLRAPSSARLPRARETPSVSTSAHATDFQPRCNP